MRIVIVLVLMLSWLSLSVAAAPARAQDAAPIVLGANTTGMADDMGPAMDGFAARTGAMPQIAMFYRDWETGWSTALLDPRFVKPVTDRGAVPMITWEPWLDTRGGSVAQPDYALARIAAGDHDAYLRRSAREAKAFAKPFLLRFAHEMNGGWTSWGAGVNSNTPQDYVAAWRHVVDLFRAEGATNVRWVWSPNVGGENIGVPRFEPFFPGEDYVDWVALDGYNWGAHKGSGWRSLSEVFAGNYDELTRLSAKPVMIAETAAPEQGGDKAAWIREGLLNAIPTRMPRVRALVWFDRDKETDWRVNSSPASLDAFRAVASSARYGGRAAALWDDAVPPTPAPAPDSPAPGSQPPAPPSDVPVSGGSLPASSPGGSAPAPSAPAPSPPAGPPSAPSQPVAPAAVPTVAPTFAAPAAVASAFVGAAPSSRPASVRGSASSRATRAHAARVRALKRLRAEALRRRAALRRAAKARRAAATRRRAAWRRR